MEWLERNHEATSRGAPVATEVEVNILVCDKCKRKNVDITEVEKRCKFRAYPIV